MIFDVFCNYVEGKMKFVCWLAEKFVCWFERINVMNLQCNLTFLLYISLLLKALDYKTSSL